MITTKDTKRVVAIFLALSLALPSPALALRDQAVSEKKPEVLSGLEEALRDDPAQLVQLASTALGLSPSLSTPVAIPPPVTSFLSAGMEEWKELNYHLTRLGSDNSGAIGLALDAIYAGLTGQFKKYPRSGEIAIAILESLRRVHSSDPNTSSGLQPKHLLVLQALMETKALDVASEEQLGKITQLLSDFYIWLDETRSERSLFQIYMHGFSLSVFVSYFATTFRTKIPSGYEGVVSFLSGIAHSDLVVQKYKERRRVSRGAQRAMETLRKRDVTPKMGALRKFFDNAGTPLDLLEEFFAEGARVVFINFSHTDLEKSYIFSGSGLASDIQALSGQTEIPPLLGLNLPPSQKENFKRFLSDEEVPEAFLQLMSDRIILYYDPTENQSDEAAIARESIKVFLRAVQNFTQFVFYGPEPGITGENAVDIQVRNLQQILKQNPRNRILAIDGPPEIDSHRLSKQHLHLKARSHKGEVAYSLAPFLKENLPNPSIVVSIVEMGLEDAYTQDVHELLGIKSLREFLSNDYSNRSFGIRLGKGRTPFDKKRFSNDFKEKFPDAYDGLIALGRKDRGGDRNRRRRAPSPGSRQFNQSLGKKGQAKKAVSMTAGLEEVRGFKSVQEFVTVHGELLRKQGLLERAQALAKQSNHVTTISGSATPESPTAVIAYTHPEWEHPVDAQLKRGSIPSVFFVTSSYPANGYLYPPAVVIRQAGTTLPVEPNPAAPVIALRSLADVGNLTPGFVYAVAVNKNLAGQIIGPIIGILTFTDEQGRTIHAIFA